MLIHNAQIINEGRTFTGYVLTEGEYIKEVREGAPDESLLQSIDEIIDAKMKYLIPGVIDEHVHFRDPGLTHKGDMATESRAAVCGGVTSFIDMPNTIPATVTNAALEEKMRHAAEVSWCNYGFFLGATPDNLDEILNADYTKIAGVKLFLGSSTGKMAVTEKDRVEEIFEKSPALIAVHAEDDGVIAENRRKMLDEYGNSEDLPVALHSKIRDEQACLAATKRAVDLAKRYDARLHIMHVSTASELDMLTPGNVAGKMITAETCPQYLTFEEKDYEKLGARIKCNPSIKNHRKALIQGLIDKKLDVIGSDHAPHLLAEKEGGALKAVSGMPSIGNELEIMMDLTLNTDLTPEDIVRLMCHNPAEIYGIDRRGYIREGYYADLVLIDPEDTHTITDEDVKSKCGWTPYIYKEVRHRVCGTIVNGHWGFPERDEAHPVHALRFRQISR